MVFVVEKSFWDQKPATPSQWPFLPAGYPVPVGYPAALWPVPDVLHPKPILLQKFKNNNKNTSIKMSPTERDQITMIRASKDRSKKANVRFPLRLWCFCSPPPPILCPRGPPVKSHADDLVFFVGMGWSAIRLEFQFLAHILPKFSQFQKILSRFWKVLSRFRQFLPDLLPASGLFYVCQACQGSWKALRIED